jgi:ribokinase
MKNPAPIIAVVGSLNVDHTFHVREIPTRGMTVPAAGAITCYGGKGANQALAAARAGGAVRMIGCVGADAAGENYVQALEAEGLDLSGITRSVTEPTGSAFILVDDSGENLIVVHGGANQTLQPTDVEKNQDAIISAQMLLLQLECPLPAVRKAAALAQAARVRVILNPSPWHDELRHTPIPTDVLIVNEHEASLLLGADWPTLVQDPAALCDSAHTQCLIITAGSSPTRVFSRTEKKPLVISPPTVTPVDTVGAGDTFAGALAVALGEGLSLTAAVHFANTAGALATLKAGAQPAIPTRAEITKAADPACGIGSLRASDPT